MLGSVLISFPLVQVVHSTIDSGALKCNKQHACSIYKYCLVPGTECWTFHDPRPDGSYECKYVDRPKSTRRLSDGE